VTENEEIKHLERVIQGREKPTLGPAAARGRLAQLYLSSPDPKLRRRALETARAAYTVQKIGKDSPLYPKLRHVEAMALRLDGTAQRREAAAMDLEAWKISLEKAPGEAILIGAEWADWAWDKDLFDEAAEAYSNAHRAQRRFLLRQVLSSEERLKVQSQTTYATRGAFALAARDDLREALKLLERTSDLTFGAGADRRAIRLLRHTHPDLAARLDSAIHETNRFVKPQSDKWGLDQYGNLAEAARAAQAKLDVVVLEVRSVSGFGSFALPSGWPDIVAAARGTALVYLAPTTKGTLAVVVRSSGNDNVQVAHEILPDGLREIHTASKPFIDSEFGSPRADSRAALSDLLEFLGRKILVPVLDMLAAAGHGDQPFVVLPFSMLRYLPLAVASPLASNDNTGEVSLAPGRIRFAYSARALTQSRMVTDEGQLNAFVVNNPRPLPPKYNLLQLANFEVEAISRHFPTTIVAGPEARTARVLAGLANSGLIHFSCHGTVASDLAYSGVLVLSNFEMLAYQQVRLADNVTARLVVLAACQSGIAGITIEHSLSLPAAFLAAGAKGVLGSLWHAEEMATLLLMIRFYELWPTQQSDPAVALALAQQWLRSTPAEGLRAVAPPAALAMSAGRVLREAPVASLPYAHPWYWGNFFVAGG
jgi:CHAT domain-containing protein